MARRLSLLCGAAALAAGIAAPAYAATGSPPVTAPDHVKVHAGEGTPVDVTANDTDPDGDSLQVCRLGRLPRALGASQVQDGTLVVVASPKARGTYTLTYYACDDSYLSAGTLTVRVTPPRPSIDVRPLGDSPPGKIRIVNTYKHVTFHCSWHPLDTAKLEGKAVVRPRSSVVITAHEARLQIDCESPRIGMSAIFDRIGPPLVARTRW